MKQSQETKDALAKQKSEFEAQKVDDLAKLVAENDKKYYIVFVTKEELNLIRAIVYGFAGMILVAFGTALVKVVIK